MGMTWRSHGLHLELGDRLGFDTVTGREVFPSGWVEVDGPEGNGVLHAVELDGPRPRLDGLSTRIEPYLAAQKAGQPQPVLLIFQTRAGEEQLLRNYPHLWALTTTVAEAINGSHFRQDVDLALPGPWVRYRPSARGGAWGRNLGGAHPLRGKSLVRRQPPMNPRVKRCHGPKQFPSLVLRQPLKKRGEMSRAQAVQTCNFHPEIWRRLDRTFARGCGFRSLSGCRVQEGAMGAKTIAPCRNVQLTRSISGSAGRLGQLQEMRSRPARSTSAWGASGDLLRSTRYLLLHKNRVEIHAHGTHRSRGRAAPALGRCKNCSKIPKSGDPFREATQA